VKVAGGGGDLIAEDMNTKSSPEREASDFTYEEQGQ